MMAKEPYSRDVWKLILYATKQYYFRHTFSIWSCSCCSFPERNTCGKNLSTIRKTLCNVTLCKKSASPQNKTGLSFDLTMFPNTTNLFQRRVHKKLVLSPGILFWWNPREVDKRLSATVKFSPPFGLFVAFCLAVSFVREDAGTCSGS